MNWFPDKSSMEILWFNYVILILYFLSLFSKQYLEMEKLTKILMRLFAIGLGLPESFFDDKLTNHQSCLRAVYYPPVKSGDILNERAGEHTDWGCLTILKPDKFVSIPFRLIYNIFYFKMVLKLSC